MEGMSHLIRVAEVEFYHSWDKEWSERVYDYLVDTNVDVSEGDLVILEAGESFSIGRIRSFVPRSEKANAFVVAKLDDNIKQTWEENKERSRKRYELQYDIIKRSEELGPEQAMDDPELHALFDAFEELDWQ